MNMQREGRVGLNVKLQVLFPKPVAKMDIF